MVISASILLYLGLFAAISSLQLFKCNRDIRAGLLRGEAIFEITHVICLYVKIVFATVANADAISKYYRLSALVHFIEYIYEVLLNIDKFEQSGRAVPGQAHAFDISQVVLDKQLHLR